MRKRIASLLLAVCLTAGLMPILAREASAEENYEQAWYPAAHMYVVQIAYESYSHLSYNTMDIDNIKNLPENETRIFAPFTGVIVYNDTQNKGTKYEGFGNYGYVLLQSLNKVRYADGTVDYMTVGFMHDEDISDLPQGKVIKQGEFFYDLGGMGNGNPDAYDDHVEVTVFKGQFRSLSGPNKDGGYTVGKWLRRFNEAKKQNKGTKSERRSHGDIYAFDAFFVNTERTRTSLYTSVGYMRKGNTMGGKSAPSDWSGKWKDLNGNPFPALPTVSGCKAPDALKTGEKFSVTGTVSSKAKILSVTVGVYTAETGGTMKTGKTVSPSDPQHGKTPRVNSYKLSQLDSAVQFDKLPAGTYWYRVTAKNGGGTVVLVNQKFTVGDAAPAPAALPTISNENLPGTLTAGDGFSVRGTISSGTKLTSVKATVYAVGNGNLQQFEKAVTANATSYNLSELASFLPFHKLPAGTYLYQVTAGNSAGTRTLVSHRFTVTAPDPTPAPAPTAVYPNPGWYALTPACAPGMRLDVAYSGASSEDPVWIWGANGSAAQSWYLLPYSDSVGHYLLVAGTNLHVKMVLDVQYGGTESGTPVWLYESNDTPAQEWIFLDAGGGYCYIVPSENQDLALAVQGGSSAEGSGLVVETRNGSLGQKWTLVQ